MTEIGEWAFVDAIISNVVIPNTVTHIREKAFIYSANLTDVTIPDSVVFIGSEAFWNCNGLSSITIPQSVISIGESAFGACNGLTSILVDENNSVYSSQDGVLFDKGKTTLMCFPVGKSGAYTIPSGVTTIANRAFMYCSNLTSVVIPEGVTRIESETFFMCSNLESISLPASINAVDFFAFFRCSKLTDVYYGGTEEDWQAIEIIGNGNEYLTGATLHSIPAADLVLPASLTVIESEAFAGLPSGTAIRIPSSVTFIADDAFAEVDDLTILGVPGSEAEAFANAHENITFIAIGN